MYLIYHHDQTDMLYEVVYITILQHYPETVSYYMSSNFIVKILKIWDTKNILPYCHKRGRDFVLQHRYASKKMQMEWQTV